MNRNRTRPPNQAATSPKRKADEIEVIEITDSSEGETRHKHSKTTRAVRPPSKPKNGRTREKSRQAIGSHDSVILLDDPPPKAGGTSSTAVKDLEQLLEKANKRIEEHKRENENLRRISEGLQLENEALRQKESTEQEGVGFNIDIDELDEITTCEICSERMWNPALLPDCGHVFCEGCLQDWFSQTLTRHVQDNPHYYEQEPLHPFVLQFLTMPHLWRHPEARGLARQATAIMPKSPVYTCPSCRETCTTSPSPVYSLKKVVSLAARAMGEEVTQTRSKSDAFTGFFPRRPRI